MSVSRVTRYSRRPCVEQVYNIFKMRYLPSRDPHEWPSVLKDYLRQCGDHWPEDNISICMDMSPY